MVLATRCAIMCTVVAMKQFLMKSMLLIKWSLQVCSEITKFRKIVWNTPIWKWDSLKDAFMLV